MDHRGADAASRSSKQRPNDGQPVGSVSGNGTSGANGQSIVPNANGNPMPMNTSYASLPPEVYEVMEVVLGYSKFGTLLGRVSQECYNELHEVLQNMGETQVNHPSNGLLSNGVGGYLNGQDPQASTDKKLRLMKFAKDQRAKFIKLLVLTEWGGKSGEEIRKLVDIKAFLDEELLSQNSAHEQIAHMRGLLSQVRQSNPDIRTALEVLSTGKASWFPDMGYIPPETFSSEKALKLLRYLNTTLSIRLNVHEILPRHLRKWHVASGRATFVVDSEFELDVLCYSEDMSDSWKFVDLRLLFSPAPAITMDGPFYAQFKAQLDYILMESGLSGCFDFLHNFILTHKIALLKSQAHDLLRIGWAGSLKVEPVHRALVLQYWTDKPGKKSWIEVGLSSGKSKNSKILWRGPPIAFLAVRWFRSGEEAKDVKLDFDWKNISMERILKTVIALHTEHILRSGRAGIPSQISTQPTSSEAEPCDCVLEVALGSPENKTTVSLEPVTGKYILQPVTAMSARAEQAINQGANLGQSITQLLAQTLQDQVQRHAQQLGWKLIAKHALRLDVVKAAVNPNVIQFSMFWPPGWTTNWALAAIIDAAGESWYILELGARGATIIHAEPLKMEKQEKKPPINRSTLSSVERVALQLLSLRVTMRDAQSRQKQASLRSEITIPRRTGAVQTFLHGWVLHLRATDLVTTKPGEDPWLEPAIRLTCQGFRADYRNVWHIASGTMVKSVAEDMRKLMSGSPQKNFTFSEDGSFSILLSTPFGESVFDELTRRLRDLGRLRSFTTTLQKRKMKLVSSSLQQVEFQYGKNCTTTVNFGTENDIKVDFSPDNPHNRIRRLLVEIINERNPELAEPFRDDHTALDRFCTTLIFTRPILTVLSELEAAPGNLRNPSVHTHAIGKYRVAYSNPLCSFDIRIRPKDDSVCWQIEDNDKKAADVRPTPERAPNHHRLDSLKAALNAFFKDNGQGWFGIRSGVIADVDGVASALRTLHETVMGCTMAGGYMPTQQNGGIAVPAPSLNNANGAARGPGPANGNGNANGAARAQGLANGLNRQQFATGMIKSQGIKKQQQEVIELD